VMACSAWIDWVIFCQAASISTWYLCFDFSISSLTSSIVLSVSLPTFSLACSISRLCWDLSKIVFPSLFQDHGGSFLVWHRPYGKT
jgi:hypothetical protein